MCRILIHADIRPMGISFHAVVVFGLGKNLLFKYILARCESCVLTMFKYIPAAQKTVPFLSKCQNQQNTVDIDFERSLALLYTSPFS